MAERPPQIQVVGAVAPSGRRARRLGIGLLLSLIVGWPALSVALADADAFEASIVRFLLSVAVSVGGVLFLGGLYDRFTTDERPDPTGSAIAAAGHFRERGDE